MPRKQVTRLRKECGELAGHSWRQAERVAAAATDVVRHWLPDDQEVVDLLHFQLCIGEKLENNRDSLTATDNHHTHELRIDSNLREDRDRWTSDLRQRAIRLRDSLDGLFGPGGATKIFEEAAIIPTDPVALHQLMGHVRDNLDDDDFPMPKPLQKSFKLDRKDAIADFEESHQGLGVALKGLEAAASDSKHSQSLKDAEVDEVAVFNGKVYRYYEALYDLIGFDRLSNRLRRSSRRTASGNEPDNPNADDPAADLAAVGFDPLEERRSDGVPQEANDTDLKAAA